jgi:hypothetical protein
MFTTDTTSFDLHYDETGNAVGDPVDGGRTERVNVLLDIISFGFSGNLLASDRYTYSDGTVIYDTEEVIKFTFTSATGGTYEEGYDEGDGFYVENTGTFEEANINLSLQTNWQRSETMDTELSTQYWQIGATSGDSVAYNEGELNFIFADVEHESEEEHVEDGSEEEHIEDSDVQEIEISYAGALPLDEDWQIVIDDTYISDSVDQFVMGYQLESERLFFDCEFGVRNLGSGREVYFYADNGLGNYFPSPDGAFLPETDPWNTEITDAHRAYEYISLSRPNNRSILRFNQIIEFDYGEPQIIGRYNYGPFAFTTADPLIENGLSFRIQHLASTRELIYSYQPDGVSDWTEVARINLSNGAATGLPGSGTLTGRLPSSSENLFFAVDVDKYSAEAIPIESIEIGGIYISNYTPPPTPVDTDGDGLDDSVETNTGIYESLSDTGTDPNNADSSGDGLFDGAVVSAGFNPNVDYSSLIAIVPNSTVDMNLRSLRLERAGNGAFNMKFDLEMSTDLETWSPHTSHSLELTVPDQSKTFMRLNVK